MLAAPPHPAPPRHHHALLRCEQDGERDETFNPVLEMSQWLEREREKGSAAAAVGEQEGRERKEKGEGAAGKFF